MTVKYSCRQCGKPVEVSHIPYSAVLTLGDGSPVTYELCSECVHAIAMQIEFPGVGEVAMIDKDKERGENY